MAARTLFIAFDLLEPSRNGDEVLRRINELGPGDALLFHLALVRTSLSVEDAYDHVKLALEDGDHLLIVESDAAIFSNWERPRLAELLAGWSQR